MARATYDNNNNLTASKDNKYEFCGEIKINNNSTWKLHYDTFNKTIKTTRYKDNNIIDYTIGVYYNSDNDTIYWNNDTTLYNINKVRRTFYFKNIEEYCIIMTIVINMCNHIKVSKQEMRWLGRQHQIINDTNLFDRDTIELKREYYELKDI